MQPLTYAYETQMHRSTNMTPISLVLSRHQSGPTTVPQPSSKIIYSYDETDPRWLHFSFQRKIATLHAEADTHMWGRGPQ